MGVPFSASNRMRGHSPETNPHPAMPRAEEQDWRKNTPPPESRFNGARHSGAKRPRRAAPVGLDSENSKDRRRDPIRPGQGNPKLNGTRTRDKGPFPRWIRGSVCGSVPSGDLLCLGGLYLVWRLENGRVLAVKKGRISGCGSAGLGLMRVSPSASPHFGNINCDALSSLQLAVIPEVYAPRLIEPWPRKFRILL